MREPKRPVRPDCDAGMQVTDVRAEVEPAMAEAAADGSARTLDEAEECPLSHPNCVRAWAPVVGSEDRS